MIPEVFRGVAEQYSDRLAIIDGDQRITYGELFERVQDVREWLRDALGSQPGVIAAALDNSWQLVAGFFAASGLGCSFMPCNPQWRAAELLSLAERLGFRNAIVEARLSAEWNQILDQIPGARLITRETIPSGNSRSASTWLPVTNAAELDDPAVYLSTSGSLGAPRLVPRSHRNLRAIASNVAHTLEVGRNGVFSAWFLFITRMDLTTACWCRC